ncbi:MAG: hypothetical protein H7230_04650 [Candidatus Parcubacteria bacterium]|nr:hypothetical protein [Candidatus Paceibacterota bacterium]
MTAEALQQPIVITEVIKPLAKTQEEDQYNEEAVRNKLFGLYDRDRIQTLSDTFFIVAFSLVVLDLKVPRADSGILNQSNINIDVLLSSFGQVMGIIMITLINLAIFWAIFKQMIKHSNKTFDKNYFISAVFFYTSILLLPFVHTIFYVYQGSHIVQSIYAGHLALISLFQLTTLLYIWSTKGENHIEVTMHHKLLLQITLAFVINLTIAGVSYFFGLFNPWLLLLAPLIYLIVDIFWVNKLTKSTIAELDNQSTI